MAHRFAMSWLVLSFVSFCVQTVSADWQSWRGPLGWGSVEEGSFAREVSDQTTNWKVALPGKGCSTPIVVDQSIYVTAPIDGKDALIAYDWSGQKKWNVVFGEQKEGKHRNGSGCNASPVSDGNQVFVFFKSGVLAAVDPDGIIRWQTNLVDRFGKDTLYWDHGTSPVLTEKSVIFARMHEGESWIAAFDKATGEIQWKVARNYDVPRECDHGYASPLVIQHQGKEALLVWGAQHLTIHNPANGEVLWTCGGFNLESKPLWPSVATPVVVGEMAVIAYGRNDKRAPQLYGIHLGGSGDVTKTNHKWFRDDVSTFVPTPSVYQGKVYLVRDRGEVECIDPKTGDTVWSDRFPKNRNNYYASPLIAGGLLFAPREDGVVFIADISHDKLDILSENDLQQSIIGSPVPSENHIFLRGETHLMSVSK